VNITENFNWSVNAEDHWLLFKNALALFSKGNNVLSSEGKIAISVELGRPLSWSQQVRQEQVVESVFLHVLLL
jgi:hypothetical protein